MAEFFNPIGGGTRNLIGSIDRDLSILNYRYTIEIGSRACTDVLRGSSCARVFREEPESGLIEDYRR